MTDGLPIDRIDTPAELRAAQGRLADLRRRVPPWDRERVELASAIRDYAARVVAAREARGEGRGA